MSPDPDFGQGTDLDMVLRGVVVDLLRDLWAMSSTEREALVVFAELADADPTCPRRHQLVLQRIASMARIIDSAYQEALTSLQASIEQPSPPHLVSVPDPSPRRENGSVRSS